MTTTDIEEFATSKIKDEIRKNRDCLRAFINENDKTPLWDGNIFVYRGENKTNDLYEGKIDVQIKGRHIEEFKENNTFPISLETLRGYQKEVKGTLLFVVDFIDDDNFKIYYCNLLPVDLYQILKNVKDDQKSTSLKLKEINDKGTLTFKNICLNFYRDSNRQANRRIIDESEFGKIESMEIEFIADKENYEEYMEIGDVYSYAKLKDTNEEVVTIKAMEFVPYTTQKRDIMINGKKYYSQFTLYGKDENKIYVGPLIIDQDLCNINFDLKGTLKEKIKKLRFILDLFKYEYIEYGTIKREYHFTDKEQIKRNIDIYEKRLKYFQKINEVFKFFNTEFDVAYEDLNSDDIRKLHHLLNLYDGNFSDETKDLQKYYIIINKYKFIFVTLRTETGNKIINYYSKDMLDSIVCFLFDDKRRIKNSVFSSISKGDVIDVSNYNSKIILKSYKDIELCEEVLDSINQLILTFISAYDETNNREFINIADSLSQINCKNRNDDVDIINAKQIKYRKKGLSTNDKKLLSDISKKEENKGNYQILCCISLLIDNHYSFEENFSEMSKKEKSNFKKFPIYNLATQK